MSEKLARAIKDLRADLNRDKGGLVKVFGDQLSLVLDALEPVDDVIREGDRVELTKDLGGVGCYSAFMYTGVQGTVKRIAEISWEDSYNYIVILDTKPENLDGYAFHLNELKKVV